jgi:YD repeat-containing protein
LSYDPLGRLWQVASPAGTTRFLYDGDRLVLEYNGGGTVLRAYDHGTGPDEPLVWYEAVPGGTSRRYLHADHQGSIIAVADQNGNPIAVNAYDEWGIPNASNLGRFGYTGQAWLPLRPKVFFSSGRTVVQLRAGLPLGRSASFRLK